MLRFLVGLQAFIIRTSSDWRRFALVVVFFVVALRLLIGTGEQFAAHTGGIQPFDLQNGLKAQEIPLQLETYDDRARELYGAFALIDFFFPVLGALLLAASAAFLLRRGLPRVSKRVLGLRLLPLFFIPALFDWLENLAAIALIWLDPGGAEWLPATLVAAKRLKLAFVIGSQLLVVLLAISAATGWVMRRVRPGAPAG